MLKSIFKIQKTPEIVQNVIKESYKKYNKRNVYQLTLRNNNDFKIMEADYEVHNTLGCGFMEKVYENALIKELQDKGYKV